MNTLLEFITFVKGVEYLIVIAFCFGFIALWMLVNSRDKMGMSKIVSFVIPLSIIFGGGAVILSSSGTSDSPAVSNTTEAAIVELTADHKNAEPDINKSWPTVNKSEYLSIKYGPATAFHSVMSEKVSCTTCHHNSGDEIHACKDCHDSPANPHDSTKPGLKAAYHERCISCHQAEISGPDSCKKCHTGEAQASVVAAPARPHELTWDTCSRCHKKGIPNGGVESKIVYHDSCVKCHSKGIAGAALIPEDHAGRASNTCQGCHRPAGG